MKLSTHSISSAATVHPERKSDETLYEGRGSRISIGEGALTRIASCATIIWIGKGNIEERALLYSLLNLDGNIIFKSKASLNSHSVLLLTRITFCGQRSRALLNSSTDWCSPLRPGFRSHGRPCSARVSPRTLLRALGCMEWAG
jgi:hypothetical protein